MKTPLKFSNDPGVTFSLDSDEHGASCVLVTGEDYDAVLASALNVKNVMPLAQCPEVGEVKQDMGNGSWRAQVRTRRQS